MKVFIATPCFDGKPCVEYQHSMTDTLAVLDKLGIEATVNYRSKDAYVHRARNSLARDFLKSDATDLMFIDADEGWDFKAVPRVLMRPYEFVGGAYPFKKDEEGYPVLIRTNDAGIPVVDPETGCISASMLPTGFWRLRRSVVETMAPHCDWYWDDNEKTVAFFETPIVNHEWIGEDPWFCRKWQSIGGQIWLEPDIDFTHVGVKAWKGNYHEFLMRQPGGKNAA